MAVLRGFFLKIKSCNPVSDHNTLDRHSHQMFEDFRQTVASFGHRGAYIQYACMWQGLVLDIQVYEKHQRNWIYNGRLCNMYIACAFCYLNTNHFTHIIVSFIINQLKFKVNFLYASFIPCITIHINKQAQRRAATKTVTLT